MLEQKRIESLPLYTLASRNSNAQKTVCSNLLQCCSHRHLFYGWFDAQASNCTKPSETKPNQLTWSRGHKPNEQPSNHSSRQRTNPCTVTTLQRLCNATASDNATTKQRRSNDEATTKQRRSNDEATTKQRRSNDEATTRQQLCNGAPHQRCREKERSLSLVASQNHFRCHFH